jgi:hypothetical protein
MKPTVSDLTEKVLEFFDHLPPNQDSVEKDFRSAVWSLCQRIKQAEADSDGGQFIPPPLF